MNYRFNWSAVSGGAPYVTISVLGIAFNSVSIEKLGTPEKIIVGFDEEKCAIGIKKYEGENNVRPYEFASRAKNGWIRIGCKDFVKYLQSISGVDFGEAKKYVAKYEPSENIMVVDIKAEEIEG